MTGPSYDHRCTNLRRLIVHEDIADELTERIVRADASLPAGDPFREDTVVGPLISEQALDALAKALDAAQADSGKLPAGGDRLLREQAPAAAYGHPAVVRTPAPTAVVREDTFAPVPYVPTYRALEEAIELHSGSPGDCPSSVFARARREAGRSSPPTARTAASPVPQCPPTGPATVVGRSRGPGGRARPRREDPRHQPR